MACGRGHRPAPSLPIFGGVSLNFAFFRGTGTEVNLLGGSTVLPEKVRREAGFTIVADLLLLGPLAVMFCGTPSNTRICALEDHVLVVYLSPFCYLVAIRGREATGFVPSPSFK